MSEERVVRPAAKMRQAMDAFKKEREALAKENAMNKSIPEAVVEAVARAICVACEENPDRQGDTRGNEFRWQDYREVALAAISALAAEQQPTEGEEIMVNTPHDVFILPLHPSGLSSGPRFVVHVPELQRESVTVRYDLSSAQTESAIRDALIWMGWTPPAGGAQAALEAVREECGALLYALRQIAEWPDGGNRYGQENIRRFAQAAIDAAMQRTSGGDHD